MKITMATLLKVRDALVAAQPALVKAPGDAAWNAYLGVVSASVELESVIKQLDWEITDTKYDKYAEETYGEMREAA